MTQSRRLTPVIALVAAAALLLTILGSAPADAGSVRTYRVTITNLTSGQPMTPFVVATHSGSTGIFEVKKKTTTFEDGPIGPVLNAFSRATTGNTPSRAASNSAVSTATCQRQLSIA